MPRAEALERAAAQEREDSVVEATSPRRRRFSRDEYYRMAEAGILRRDERIELLEGELIPMAAIGTRHAACVNRLTQLLTSRLGDRALVAVQNPIVLSERSEPQPDLCLLRPREDFYADEHPTPPDVLLLIEVGDSTFPFDRGVKARLYARGGVGELWLVDLPSEALWILRGPVGADYGETRRLGRGRSVAPLAFPDLEVAVDEVLGPPPPTINPASAAGP